MTDELESDDDGGNRHAHSISQTLTRIRRAGWSVAVHNDYNLNGKKHTFWLFTHPSGLWAKGEGRSDRRALAAAEAQIKERNSVREQIEKEVCAWLRDVAMDVPAKDAARGIEAGSHIPVKPRG